MSLSKENTCEIPKVIHYFWFGNGPLPSCAKKCMESWERFLPGWTVKRWDESTFDVNAIPYTAEAYKAGKYAFVSDVARYFVLYNEGGIYLEPDVELIKPLDAILHAGSFMACETSEPPMINSGLGFAVEKGLPVIGEILAGYADRHFINPDGSYNYTTVVDYTTDLLRKRGLKDVPGIQSVAGLTIYPQEYFNPITGDARVKRVTPNTVAINYGAATWVSGWPKYREKIKKFVGPALSRYLIALKRALFGRSGRSTY